MIAERRLALLVALVTVVATSLAGAGEPTSLKAIMQDLRDNLVDITDGLVADDLGLVARGAAGIADHPRIPAGQVQRVAEELGEDMPIFKRLDTWVHDLALEIKVAAETSDRSAIAANYQKMMEGCMACHNAFKDRVAAALGPTDSSLSPSTETRILLQETTVRAPLADVWHAWTSADGLSYISGQSNVELRVGGAYEWFLDGEPDEYGIVGSEGSRILAYIPREMIAFSWTFPPDIPELRYADERTQVVVTFHEDDDGQVRVRLRVLGWQAGESWERGWAYFDRAWGAVLAAMKQHLEKVCGANDC